MGARLYDPATGLFMSPDPTVAYPYDSQDLNQYAYVGDNPMTWVDLYGYSWWGGMNWPQLGLGVLQIAGGWAGAELDTGIVVFGAATFPEDPLSVPAIAFGSLGAGGNALILSAGVRNVISAVTGKSKVWTAEDIAQANHIPSNLSKLMLAASITGDILENLPKSLLMNYDETHLEQDAIFDGGILMGPNGIPIGVNFATDFANSALQFYGMYTSKYTSNGILTMNTLSGWVINCGGDGCTATGFLPHSGEEVTTSGNGIIGEVGYYPGGGIAVGLPGGGSMILEDGGALGTIVWGTEGALATLGE
jgi:hypothetical protein